MNTVEELLSNQLGHTCSKISDHNHESISCNDKGRSAFYMQRTYLPNSLATALIDLIVQLHFTLQPPPPPKKKSPR